MQSSDHGFLRLGSIPQLQQGVGHTRLGLDDLFGLAPMLCAGYLLAEQFQRPGVVATLMRQFSERRQY